MIYLFNVIIYLLYLFINLNRILYVLLYIFNNNTLYYIFIIFIIVCMFFASTY